MRWNEEIRRRQEEERKRQEELQKQINHEKERVSNLIETASNWQKSQMIREFISAVEKAQAEGECHFTPACSWDEWFKWAKDQADRLDPLTKSPSSILDEKIERKRFDNDWRY